jgi:hypothetical protein
VHLRRAVVLPHGCDGQGKYRTRQWPAFPDTVPTDWHGLDACAPEGGKFAEPSHAMESMLRHRRTQATVRWRWRWHWSALLSDLRRHRWVHRSALKALAVQLRNPSNSVIGAAASGGKSLTQVGGDCNHILRPSTRPNNSPPYQNAVARICSPWTLLVNIC